MNGNVSRRRVLQNAAVVGAGIGVGRQATATELTVTKAGARDGFAAFYLAAADRVVPTDTAEGPSGVRDTLDWLGPERGTDTYRVRGAIETFLLHGNATVRVDGVRRDPATLGRNPVDVDASTLGRTLRVESTGTGFGPFAVTASGGVAPSDTFEGATDGYTAVDWVGPRRGVDEVRFDGDITRFFATEHVRVSVDGREVPPVRLADGERTDPADTGGGGGGDGGGPAIEFLDCRTVRFTGEFAAVLVHTEYNGPGGVSDSILPLRRGELARRADDTYVVSVDQLDREYGVNGSVVTWVTAYDGNSEPLASRSITDADLDPDACFQRVAPEVRTTVESVAPTGADSYAVTFAYTNEQDTTLYAFDAGLRGTVGDGRPPAELDPGRNTFTVEWAPADGNERLTWVAGLEDGFAGLDGPVTARTEPARRYGGTGGGRPTVEFLDCRTARISGEFAEVRLTTVFNGTGGAADGVLPFEPRELQRRPDGTFVARLGQLGYDDGVNGSVLARVTVYDADMDVLADLDISDSTLDVEECYRQVAPDVRAAVEAVTPTGSAGYEVTFAYRNDHDRPLSVVPELRGTVAAGSPPDELRPGRNTFTVEWRPDGGDERLVWRPLGPRGWVGLDAPVVARTAPARSLGGAGPRAETSGPPTETTTPDAETASTAAPGTPTESPSATSAGTSTQTPTDTRTRTPTATETPTPEPDTPTEAPTQSTPTPEPDRPTRTPTSEPDTPTPDAETAVSGETDDDGTATLVRWLGLD